MRYPSTPLVLIAAGLLAVASPVLAFHAQVTGPWHNDPPPFGRVLSAAPGRAPLLELTPRELRLAEFLGYDAQLVEAQDDALPAPPSPRRRVKGPLAGAQAKVMPSDPTRPIRVEDVGSPGAATPGRAINIPVTVRSYLPNTAYMAVGLYEETTTGSRPLTMHTASMASGQTRIFDFSLTLPSGQVATPYIIGTFYYTTEWVQSDCWRFPINSAGPAPSERVAILVNRPIFDAALPLLEQYRDAVESRFSAQLSIYQINYTRRQDVRSLLRSLYRDQGITGAILVGLVPWPAWEFPWVDNCPAPYYYEDLDGAWYNRDGDAYLDGWAEGPHPGPEIWVAWMRPPQSQESRVLQYLQRCLAYYEGATPHLAQGLVHMSSDWGFSVGRMRRAVGNIYGQTPMVVGGPNVAVSAGTWLGGLAAGYSVCNVWAHSNSLYHRFDLGTSPLTAYWYEVAAVSPGPVLTVNYGCHCADFATAPDGNFALGYVQLNPGGLAQLGVTRKISTGTQAVFFNSLAAGRCVGRAYMDFLQYHYRPAWITYWFPGTDMSTFVWDFALNGNPFLVFGPAQ